MITDLGINDFLQKYFLHSICLLDHQMFFLSHLHHPQQLLHFHAKRRILHRLYHEIIRIHFITTDCILCHICYKNQKRLFIHLTDFPRCLHPICSWHLNIQQNQIPYFRIIFQKSIPAFKMIHLIMNLIFCTKFIYISFQ